MDWNKLLASAREIVHTELIEVGGTHVTIGSILIFVLVLALAYLLSRLFRRAIDKWLRRGPMYTEASSQITQKLFHYVIMLVGFVAALQTVGIDLSTLFAAGAVFAVGLGFAMQNVSQNFVSGIILMFERSIKTGDVLEIDGTVVLVQKMGIRSTIVRTRDEEEMIVPNSILVQGVVKNFTLSDSLFLLRADVGVTYGSDMKQVREVLIKTAKEVPWGTEGEEPRVLMTGFGTSSVDFAVLVWVDDPWLSRRLLSDLYDRLWWALKDASVTIAFPQLDVHIDAGIEKALTKPAEGGK